VFLFSLTIHEISSDGLNKLTKTHFRLFGNGITPFRPCGKSHPGMHHSTQESMNIAGASLSASLIRLREIWPRNADLNVSIAWSELMDRKMAEPTTTQGNLVFSLASYDSAEIIARPDGRETPSIAS
jgi:hypothetical protein